MRPTRSPILQTGYVQPMTQTLLPDTAWSGGHLLLGDPGAVDKVRRKVLSASVAASTLKCPAAMAASRLLPRNEDPFSDAEIGTAMHAVFEDLYALPAPERTHEKIDELVNSAGSQKWALEKLEKQTKDALRANDANRRNWIEQISSLCHGIFEIEDPRSVIVIGIEATLFVTVRDIPSICKIDRIDWVPCTPDAVGAVTLEQLRNRHSLLVSEIDDLPEVADGDKEAWKAKRNLEDRRDWFETTIATVEASGEHSGKIAIRDYKKSNDPKKLKTPNPMYSDDYGDQQRLYAFGIETYTGIRPAMATLYFPALGKVREINLSAPEMDKMLLGYSGAWKLMNDSADRAKFETRPSKVCAWCELVNSCPSAHPATRAAPGTPEERMDRFQLTARRQYGAVELGIPTLRPGAAAAEARTSEAPREDSVDVDTPMVFANAAEPESATDAVETPELEQPAEPIPAQGDDLFPITLGDPSTSTGTPDAGTPVVSAPGDEVPPAPGMCAETAREPNQGGSVTEQNIRVRAEAAPQQELIGFDLNLNSWSAIALAGIVSQSFKHMDEQNIPVSREAWAHFNNVLGGIVLRAQAQLTGQATWQAGAQTRIRGLLAARLERRPFPFKRPVGEIEKWMADTEKFLIVGMTELIDLHGRDLLQNDSHNYFAAAVQQ